MLVGCIFKSIVNLRLLYFWGGGTGQISPEAMSELLCAVGIMLS